MTTIIPLLLTFMQAISSGAGENLDNYINQNPESLDTIVAVLQENSGTDIDLDELIQNGDSFSPKSSDIFGGGKRVIVDTKDYIHEFYPGYVWEREEKVLTSDVSAGIPLNMGTDFPQADLDQAVIESGIVSSYGGCGSIAMIGILDYFARYLGYDSIMADPTNSRDRIDLAVDVFRETFQINLGENTLIFPWDYVNACNSLLDKFGLGDIIECNYYFSWGNSKDALLDIIVEHVNAGLPVTMYTSIFSGDTLFSEHYTNIYGYEKWVGMKNDGSRETIEKYMLEARLNWAGYDGIYFADDNILDTSMMGLVYYDVNYSNFYSFYDDDFSEDFVNDSGGGQYFFYNIDEPVTLANGRILQTSRLRTSYIENQYLVLSPNREGAGTAYLDLTFPNSVSRLQFTASMWSDLEGADNEEFTLQYYDEGWIDHIHINPSELSTFKDTPDSFQVLFPKDTNRIRFYATHSIPGGDRNKGRICLDNFVVQYN